MTAEAPAAEGPGASPFDRLLALYLVSFAVTHDGVLDVSRLGLCLAAAAALVAVPGGPVPRGAWVVAAALLVLNLALTWFQSANHTFLTTAVVLLMATQRAGVGLPATAFRCLLVMVLAFAVVQKLLSANFMSGRLLAFFVLQGDILPGPLSWIWPELPGAVAANRANLEAARSLAADTPIDLPLIVPGEGLAAAARVMSWLAVAAEASIAALAVFARRHERVFHVVLLGFVAGTYLLRNENHFLALMCLIGLGSARRFDRLVETGYVAAVVLLCTLAVLDLRAPWIQGF